MKQRNLGALTVSAIGLGCMGMSEYYGPTDEEESIATIRRALDIGVTFLDTSDLYGSGHNEELVGRAIDGRRDEVQLATKFAIRREGGVRSVDNSPEWIHAACDASLRRLGVDRIDLYYMHRRNPDVPIEESVGAMAELVKEGKVGHLGLSEVSAETLRAACAVHPIAALQSEWSLFTRGLEVEIVPTARELGVGIVPYSPLGRGELTGALEISSEDDFRPPPPASSARTASATCAWSSGRDPSRTRQAARRPSSRSPGCCARATTWRPSPAPNASAIWRRTRRPWRSSSATSSWRP